MRTIELGGDHLTVAAVAVRAAVPGGRGRVPLGVDDPVGRPSLRSTEEESSADEGSEEHSFDGEESSREARAGGHGLSLCT